MAPLDTEPEPQQTPIEELPSLDHLVPEPVLRESRDDAWRQWMAVGLGLVALLAALAVAFAIVSLADGAGSAATTTTVRAAAPAAAPAAAADKPAPTLAQSKGVAFEKFRKVDPTLPAVPAGAVKKFTVDVLQHVTQVDPSLAPTEAWTYAVNGKAYRGTAASPPIVVEQGDRVQITFVNGSTRKMGVNMAHSIDFHSAEVAPNKNYIDVMPGRRITISFVAKHPGVFMYHCATQPVLMHTSAGMMGMMVVKPRNLAPVDRELWMTQEEFYLGAPGKPADMAKMSAEKPDVIAFNGYANQYKTSPIAVRKGERIRMYVLNAGPSKWSAFHVIGTVFDKVVGDNGVAHDVQTASLAPSQGMYAEFTLDQEGNFPFVTHSFGDMVKGAAGILHTAGAPLPKGPEAPAPAAAGGAAHGAHAATAAAGTVPVTLGEMFVRPGAASAKAGTVTFDVANRGATMHQFAIGRDPLTMAGSEPAPAAAIAKSGMLEANGRARVTAKLAPGRYVLYCLLGGHYAAGQHVPFSVTG